PVEISAEKPGEKALEALVEGAFHGLNNGLCNRCQVVCLQGFGLFCPVRKEVLTARDSLFSTEERVTGV
ncbi:MAG TPA: hypothetical protein VGR07_11005, partial [Thermoanaerobaculia bacterium]|nr:hypothetical protein [Thermoanaerobaculia bacterium]